MVQVVLDKPAARAAIYVAFGMVMFAAFFVITFPDTRIKQIVEVQAEAALDHKYDVRIADIGLWRLTGVKFEGLSITERKAPDATDAPTPAADGDVDGAGEENVKLPVSIRINSLAARFAPVSSLLNLGPTATYQVDVGGGMIRGAVYQNGDGRHVEAHIDEVDLLKSPALSSYLGIPIFGVLDGQIELSLHPTRPLLTEGSIVLDGRQLTVGPATVFTDKFPVGYLEIPQTNFGNLAARVQIDSETEGRPRLVVEEFKTAGRDIRSEMWGDVQLGANMAQSRPKIEMRVQFDEAFVTKNSLAPILNMGEFRTAKAGPWYGFILWGTGGNMRFKGAPTAAQGPGQSQSED